MRNHLQANAGGANRESPVLPIRGFQWDLARQVERLDFLKNLLPRYAKWGYQELYLHLEDAVHYPALPGIGRVDAYSYQELGELVLTAAKAGIRVVPIINLLGHTQYLIKHPELRDLNELRDENDEALSQGQLCPLHPRLPEIAEKLLSDIAPYCTAGKVHVGLDESFHLGKCPRCREEVSRIGLDGHFAAHVQRLHRICSRLDLKMGIWADMLYFVPGAIAQLPSGITAYDWYYYSFAKKPRVEFFNFAERDLVPALRKQGIAYYGCPMNGAFRHEPLPVFGDRLGNIRSWWQRCRTVKAEGFLITSWEANRLALETTTAIDAAAAGLWLEQDVDDNTTLLARGLERLFSQKNARSLAHSLLAADEHAFSGYARWQINDRWDVLAGEESIKPYRAEERFFDRLCTTNGSWPKALTASFAFRRYLAQRDGFVREFAKNVFNLRRLFRSGKSGEWTARWAMMKQSAARFRTQWSTGQKACRTMWARTRKKGGNGANEILLDADARRLDELQTWLKRVAKHPETIFEATPVCGIWQLLFVVHNFSPAVQKIVVEQRDEQGLWHELISRFTIEFRSNAARPRARIKREFTVPVISPETKLRIVARGVGQVRISHVALTNGVDTLQNSGSRKKRSIGHRAPKHGFPEMNPQPDSLIDLKWNSPPQRGF